jgi:hypothetical protein
VKCSIYQDVLLSGFLFLAIYRSFVILYGPSKLNTKEMHKFFRAVSLKVGLSEHLSRSLVMIA